MAPTTEEMILKSLDEMKDKIDDIQCQNTQTKMEVNIQMEKITALNLYVCEHKKQHEDDVKHRRDINTKVWFLIATSIIVILIAVLKGVI